MTFLIRILTFLSLYCAHSFAAYAQLSGYDHCAFYEERPDDYSVVRGYVLSHRDLARVALGEEEVEGYRVSLERIHPLNFLRRGHFAFNVDDIVSCVGEFYRRNAKLAYRLIIGCEDSRSIPGINDDSVVELWPTRKCRH